MPFADNDEVRSRVVGASTWTEEETTVFRESFNEAWEDSCAKHDTPRQRERCAFALAHAARKVATR